jgi:hypothetical protein
MLKYFDRFRKRVRRGWRVSRRGGRNRRYYRRWRSKFRSNYRRSNKALRKRRKVRSVWSGACWASALRPGMALLRGLPAWRCLWLGWS